MGIRPDEMVVVGDFRFDVIAGKAAGAPTVLLTNGGPSSMKPGDPEPDHTISHLKELLHIISGTERSGGRGGGPPPGGRGTRVLNSGER
jgi:phosphoglycolate phosphatase-like HAD superfamily hydrolase